MGILMLFRDTPLATIGRTWPDGNFGHFIDFGHFPIEIPIKAEKTTTMGRKGPRAKTKIVLKSVSKMQQLGSKPNLKFLTLSK